MEYRALDADVNEIRLLTLLPGDPASKCRCILKHVSLINPPEYAALSYCWGGSALTKDIIINDVTVRVTSNLESALQHLRSKGYICLWVDAICINQEDKVEKSQQLLWMSAIYRRAKEVAAWAGEESVDSLRAIDFLKDQHTTSARDVLDRHIFFSRKDLDALASFLGRPYWRRVWIIQELALAKSTTIHCGHSSLSWVELTSALDFLNSSLSAKLHQSRDSINLLSNPDFVNARNLARFHVDSAKHFPLRFLQALKRSLRSEATEPRDRVFALLGLVYDSGLYIIAPNYRQKLEDGCIAITLSAISTTSCLDLVPLLGSGYGNSSNLPTWVPNWFGFDEASAHRQLYYILKGRKYESKETDVPMVKWYRASREASPSVSMSLSVLRVYGYVCDTINRLSCTVSEIEDAGTVGLDTEVSGENNPYISGHLAHSSDSYPINDAHKSLQAVIATLTRHTYLTLNHSEVAQAFYELWWQDPVLKNNFTKRRVSWLREAGSIHVHGTKLKDLTKKVVEMETVGDIPPKRVESGPINNTTASKKAGVVPARILSQSNKAGMLLSPDRI